MLLEVYLQKLLCGELFDLESCNFFSKDIWLGVRLFDLRTSSTLAAILSLDLRGKGKEKFSPPSSTLS